MLTLALVMTVLMGGILAYTGDLIGRRFGKKRVTMFGLRPRYTAILITSVTGVLISGITTGVLFLLVPPVRDVMLKGEQAIKQLPKVKQQLRSAAAQAEAAETKAAVLDREVADQRSTLNRLNGQVAAKQQEVDAKSNELRKVETNLRTARAELVTKQARLDQLNVRYVALSAKNERLTTANSALAAGNAALAAKNAGLQKENRELAQNNTYLARQNTVLLAEYDERSQRNIELTRQNEDLEKKGKDLERRAMALAREAEVHRAFADKKKAENDQLSAENEKLAKTNATLLSDNARLKGMIPGYASLIDAYQAARSRRVVVHKDEDLARVVVPAGLDPAGVRTYVDTLIRDASEAAKLRGASSSDSLRAVQVVDRQFLEQLPTGELHTVEITGNDRIDAVVSKLAWQSTPSAVLAIAVTNSVEQEPAGIDLQPLPNRLVYQKGQQIFWRYVNATQSSTGIYVDVVSFLKDMGRSALERGVIPRMDPLTGEPEIGAMSGGEIMDLVEKIKSTGGRARVKAVAQFDTYSADPLKLKFEVTP